MNHNFFNELRLFGFSKAELDGLSVGEMAVMVQNAWSASARAKARAARKAAKGLSKRSRKAEAGKVREDRRLNWTRPSAESEHQRRVGKALAAKTIAESRKK